MKIVTIASHRPTQPYYCYDAFFESARRFGFEPIVLRHGYGGLGTKPVMLRKAIEDGLVEGRIIFCDCFDVVFQSNPNEALAFAPPEQIIWNSEVNLFPDNPRLKELYPNHKKRFRFLNSGFAIGHTDLFRSAINELPQGELRPDKQRPDGSWDNPNDQEIWQKNYLFCLTPMTLDYDAQICQTLSGLDPDDFDMTAEKIRNKETGISPTAFHINGRKEDWKPILCKKLQLPE